MDPVPAKPAKLVPVETGPSMGDDPKALTFTVAIDDAELSAVDSSYVAPGLPLDEHLDRRKYITRIVQARLHQARFRTQILHAYQERCAICRLRHEELLDAAHILPDGHARGQPVVQNGLALCKLHHSAFDGNFLGIRPDSVIEIRKDILEETDGPVLLHGLKEFHAKKLHLPRAEQAKPDPSRLEERYGLFRKTG